MEGMMTLNLKSSIKSMIICLLVGVSSVGFAQQKALMLALDTASKSDLSISNKSGEYQIATKGKRPFIFTEALRTERAQENVALSFEYFCPQGLDFLDSSNKCNSI